MNVNQASFMSELQWNLEIFFRNHFSSVFITISMNLFDQLVIVICNPIKEC